MAKPRSPRVPTISERLREVRTTVLGKSVRDVAKLLGTSPIHVSDIETGKRVPSEALMLRIRDIYGVPEAELRAAFNRPQAVVSELATANAVAVDKVPELLRVARGLNASQWDRLITEARRLARG